MADDDAHNRAVLPEIVFPLGFVVLEAENGEVFYETGKPCYFSR